MTMVRCDMTMTLDGYVSGPKAQHPPYLDEGFFRITSWITRLASWRERQGMAGGANDTDDAPTSSSSNQVKSSTRTTSPT